MIWFIWIGIQLIAYKYGINWLNNRKVQQRIYSDSPKQHQEKVGTPTMGGVLIFFRVHSGVSYFR